MDISAEIAAIQAASQGSELRQPLVGALNKLNSGSLPAVTASDAGKILKVGANGWEVGEKSGYMPVPSASLNIISNDAYDVTNYAQVVVNVHDSGPLTTILSGTSTPSSDIGENGTIYLQYIGVPTAYTMVDYIESSGTQYIDTGIYGSQNINVDIKITPHGNKSGWDWLLSGAAANVSNSFGVGIYDWSKITFQRGTNVFYDANYSFTQDLEYEIVIDANKLYINNQLVTTLSNSTFTTPVTMYLFAGNHNGTINGIIESVRLKEAIIYESSVKVRHFVPVVRNSDNEVGLYDFITETFFGNIGTGNFTAGNTATKSIVNAFLKVNNLWQSLIGSDINDVNLGTGGV